MLDALICASAKAPQDVVRGDFRTKPDHLVFCTAMVCEHLRQLEQAIKARQIRETYRGQAWSENCREWVYFDCFIDLEAVRRCLGLDPCVVDHAHRGTHDGQERGFVCSTCNDAIMGRYEPSAGVVVFAG